MCNAAAINHPKISKYMTKKRFDAFCSLRSQKEGGDVVHFSGFARKMNHFPSLFSRAKRVRKGGAKRDLLFVMYLAKI